MSLKASITTPSAVLNCLSVLVPYLTTPREEKTALGDNVAMKCAKKLVFVWSIEREGESKWMINRQWRARLLVAGIDPELFEIIDQNRFNRAWQQLVSGTFDIKAQRAANRLGTDAPAALPIERWYEKKARCANKLAERQDSGREAAADESPYTTVLRRSIKRVLNREG
jgi:hypothetical protein